MKSNHITLFLSTLLLSTTFVSGQPTAAVWPQPHPNAKADIHLVKTFLCHLAEGQLEAAKALMADDFKAVGTSFADNRNRQQVLDVADYNQTIYTQQQYIFQDSASVVSPNGDESGGWVYIQAVWGAQQRYAPGEWPITVYFHQLARVQGGKIQETRTTYANDQLFYTLGFPLYQNIIPTAVAPADQEVRK